VRSINTPDVPAILFRTCFQVQYKIFVMNGLRLQFEFTQDSASPH
jgi:hypothetical protein